mgnify:FL=1|tara:strand:- start:173 stop:817 length:645 start_codon:yes stop_codon:yes gene_type:complete
MIFTNKLLKIINKRRRILVLVIVSAIVFGLILEKRNSQIKLQKLQLKHQQEHIEFITQENQYLLCDNERLLAMMDSLPLGSPILDTMRISSNYGWRRRPLGLGYGFHGGIDIYAAWSDTVHASGHGVVKKAYWLGGYGRCIVITHAGGYESYYAHLYRMFVEEGDSVITGQAIGRAGNSGNVTGPHLHYEIRRDGRTADPLEYMDRFFNIQLTQ